MAQKSEFVAISFKIDQFLDVEKLKYFEKLPKFLSKFWPFSETFRSCYSDLAEDFSAASKNFQ